MIKINPGDTFVRGACVGEVNGRVIGIGNLGEQSLPMDVPGHQQEREHPEVFHTCVYLFVKNGVQICRL